MKICTSLLSLLLLISWTSQSQDIKTALSEFNSPRKNLDVSCYGLNNYQPVWYPIASQSLKALLNDAETFALLSGDYRLKAEQNVNSQNSELSAKDLTRMDIEQTDAALHFFMDLKGGNQPPAFRYEGLKYDPDFDHLPAQLIKAIKANDLYGLAQAIQPDNLEYENAVRMWRKLMHTGQSASMMEEPVTSAMLSALNLPLVNKFYIYGLIDTPSLHLTNSVIDRKLRELQALLDLPITGYLDKISMKTINISFNKRKKELALLINYLRWLNDLKQSERTLILNLPSANFYVYSKGQIILQSKVIAGKITTPTPTLTSTITEAILYPYWMVPNKIATQELLPAIRRNPSYIDNYNFQVMTKQGRIVNPYQVNWNSISASNFPYIIRQSTGCDNALGIVKFNFQNPFTVYLHDTPTKPLFSYRKRFFSHGCMRIEKPVDLAHILLGENSIAIDTLTAKGCLAHQSPVTVPVDHKLPVVVMYSTAWYNQEGKVIWFDDIYNRIK